MFDDLIEYEGVHEACEEMFGFSNVKFKRPFGPTKADVLYASVWFFLDKSTCDIYSFENILTHSFKFKLEAA